METRYAVIGNLACSSVRTATSKGAARASLSLVEAPPEQRCRPAQLLPADAHASLSAKPQSRLHATLAGLAAMAVVLALGLGAHACLAAQTTRYEALAASVETVEVSVGAGDSLWSLAQEHAIEGLDTAQTVELIREWNDLSSSTLQLGMVLVVPSNG